MIKARNLSALTIVLMMQVSMSFAGDLSANVGATNNYIWRGLTQTQNGAAISGGIDFAADNGLYVGTWVSNVSYAPNDSFSYENDLYFGYSGTVKKLGYDLGYLYYNYDNASRFDFADIYASLSFAGFELGGYLLAHTEATEAPAQDFGFGEAYYVYLDYGIDIKDGLELGFHVGYHDGDFSEAFNGVPGSYTDYNISLSKGGFSFMVADTNLDDPGGLDPFDNDEPKVVISYTLDLEL
jgi:uncharacterized protein (TIGR02001 family)